eukprot:119645-Amphidinium_carterae.2
MLSSILPRFSSFCSHKRGCHSQYSKHRMSEFPSYARALVGEMIACVACLSAIVSALSTQEASDLTTLNAPS